MHLLSTTVEQNWTVKCKTCETIYYSYKNSLACGLADTHGSLNWNRAFQIIHLIRISLTTLKLMKSISWAFIQDIIDTVKWIHIHKHTLLALSRCLIPNVKFNWGALKDGCGCWFKIASILSSITHSYSCTRDSLLEWGRSGAQWIKNGPPSVTDVNLLSLLPFHNNDILKRVCSDYSCSRHFVRDKYGKDDIDPCLSGFPNSSLHPRLRQVRAFWSVLPVRGNIRKKHLN